MINIILLKNLISLHKKNFTPRLKQANLSSKNDIANFDNKLKEVIDQIKKN